jgi:hypothetical protein
MSLPWKKIATRYREAFLDSLAVITEKQLNESEVVAAAKLFKEVSEKRANPYVPLVGGRDINVEKAKENLFRTLNAME